MSDEEKKVTVEPVLSTNLPSKPNVRFERPEIASNSPPNFHTGDGVHFHNTDGPPAHTAHQVYDVESDYEDIEDDDSGHAAVDALFMHTHDGVSFHAAHGPAMQAPGRVPFTMMRRSNRRRNEHNKGQSFSPPNLVDFSVHQSSYGQQSAVRPNMGTSDGFHFHSSHSNPSHAHASDVGNHGHTHDQMDHPGLYHERDIPLKATRDWKERAFTVGIGGPVGSGKTALMLALCKRLYPEYNIAAVTNDIFTQEDAEFLMKNNALPQGRIKAVETGGCPHAAIREDISANLGALEELQAQFACQLLLIESGGDNLAANYSRELADYIIYVIDVSGGDKVPRKGGPGITQSDLLVINKTDLADAVGADLSVMDRDSKKMRDEGPTIFAEIKHGKGVEEITKLILQAYRESGSVR